MKILFLHAIRAGLAVALISFCLLCFVHAQGTVQTGYASFTADAGSTPVGSALFSVMSGGVLVSQAGVGAVEPIRKGRIFVDETGPTTGVAIVNASAAAATVTWTLRDANGAELGRQTEQLKPAQHLAKFIGQLFPAQAQGLRGSLTFESDQPIAAITLRQAQNRFGEPLYTTLPVADLAASATSDSVVFPHIASGGGYKTEILLMNPTSAAIRGELRLYASDGQPLLLSSGNSLVSQTPYEISANGIFRAEFDAASLQVGWATAIPATGNRGPFGSAVFRFLDHGQIVTEAGVAATGATSVARIFVDNAGARTGVAIANPSASRADINLKLMDRSGNVETTTTRTLEPRNHLAIFADQLFSNLTEGFTGVMEIQSNVPIVPITLKLNVNTRGDLVLTTLPVADLSRIPSARSLIFPHIAIGGEFATRLILINPDTASAAAGRLNFYQSDGSSLIVPLAAQTGSQFAYSLAASGGRQLYPGNTSRVVRLNVVDVSSNSDTTELLINEGNTLRPRVRILDAAGQSRDDYDMNFALSNSDVAAVNANGSVTAKLPGFATLSMAAGGVVSTATVTVVHVETAGGGFEAAGVARDFANKLYFASPDSNVIALLKDLRQTPATYAGIPRSAGLKNDLRLQSQFRSPSALAMNQADGSLYVADADNHAIRRVKPGNTGRVETLTGTGSPGNRDGTLQEGTFNSPQGIALDTRGNLWVADSGNHTIRRISLVTGRVETIAGAAGVFGSADGKGASAQFHTPTGIAVEAESTVQQLERDRRGAPPPPVSVIVADTGNGVLRRVSENGDVTTLRTGTARASKVLDSKSDLSDGGSPLLFDKPAGVFVDASDNIYVSEPQAGRVRVVLAGQNDVVTAAQNNTLRQPRGLAGTVTGKLVVADGSFGLQEITYGAPQISSITPSRISDLGGERVTVRGKNFAPDSFVVIGNSVLPGVSIQNTETITFVAPPLGSGRTTMTIQNRGGLSQSPFLVDPQPLTSLPVGYITTVAGGSTFAGDGGPAANARVIQPSDVAIDSSGALYILESNNHRIRRVDPRTGIINTVAGSGQAGFAGDNGPATAAQLDQPTGIAVDVAGNIYISDQFNFRIRRVDGTSGIITTIAGNGDGLTSTGDGGLATKATIAWPSGIGVDSGGNVFFSEEFYDHVRRIDAKTGVISRFAGSGSAGFSGDNGPAASARINSALRLAVDGEGNVFLTDTGNFRIRKIAANSGIITTVAGIGPDNRPAVDGVAATAAILDHPNNVSVDADGNLYIADSSAIREVIRKVDAVTGIISTVAGGGQTLPRLTGIPALSAEIEIDSVVADAAGNLYISDYFNHRIYRVDSQTRNLSISAGVGVGVVGDGGPAATSILNQPGGIAFDTGGNLLIADTENHRLRRIDARTGLITTIAGTGTQGHGGDGGPATSALLGFPSTVAVDRTGNIYVAEIDRVRKIDSRTGVISTIAQASDDYSSPIGGIAVDESSNLYISLDPRIYRLSKDGMITAFAGGGNPADDLGDGGPATAALLTNPQRLTVDKNGDLYIADHGNQSVRKVDHSTGVISTYAVLPATEYVLDRPNSMSFDANGNLFVLGYVLNRLSSTGKIQFIAGEAFQNSYSGDNGPAVRAFFNFASDVLVDNAGNIFIADTRNNRIRVIRGPLP